MKTILEERTVIIAYIRSKRLSVFATSQVTCLETSKQTSIEQLLDLDYFTLVRTANLPQILYSSLLVLGDDVTSLGGEVVSWWPAGWWRNSLVERCSERLHSGQPGHALVRLNITPICLDITQVSLNNTPVTLFTCYVSKVEVVTSLKSLFPAVCILPSVCIMQIDFYLLSAVC